MCFRYEEQYGGVCWDHFTNNWDSTETPTLVEFLAEETNMEVVKADDFSSRVIKFFETLHEDGVVRPKEAP